MFTPTEAKRILDRLESHSTPKHSSWLNMAEIEWSALNRQCPKRYISSQALLIRETETWDLQRNQRQAAVDWQFAAEDARINLN